MATRRLSYECDGGVHTVVGEGSAATGAGGGAVLGVSGGEHVRGEDPNGCVAIKKVREDTSTRGSEE